MISSLSGSNDTLASLKGELVNSEVRALITSGSALTPVEPIRRGAFSLANNEKDFSSNVYQNTAFQDIKLGPDSHFDGRTVG